MGRIQGRVQRAFEAREIEGLAAARWLAALTDDVMRSVHAYTEAQDGMRAETPWALVATGVADQEAAYSAGNWAPIRRIC